MKKIYILLCVFLTIFLSVGIWSLNETRRPDTTKEEIVTKQIGQDETPYMQSAKDSKLLQKYQEYNKDVVGLIEIEDTVLNHPLVQTVSIEDYYLYKDLDKKYNSHGVPFLSKDSLIEGQGGITIVYGHNISKRTRDVFADLAGYEDLEFYQSHPVIKTVSKSGTRQWLIFAYFIVDNSDDEPFRYTDTTVFLSKEEHDSYFEEVRLRNWLEVGVEPKMGDTYLLLSSCSRQLSGRGTNRMVVVARQLMAGESYEELVNSAKMAKDPLLPQRLR